MNLPDERIPIRCDDRVVASPDPDSDAVLLVSWDDSGSQLFELNTTGAFLWERLDGCRGIAALTEDLCASFDVEQPIAAALIAEFLAALHEKELITWTAAVI
ncbi:MAG: PqqD family protein [Cyanobacteria bacterium]|nr:PqqD family protein [Cyanobacteriota bacterium]